MGEKAEKKKKIESLSFPNSWEAGGESDTNGSWPEEDIQSGGPDFLN